MFPVIWRASPGHRNSRPAKSLPALRPSGYTDQLLAFKKEPLSANFACAGKELLRPRLRCGRTRFPTAMSVHEALVPVVKLDVFGADKQRSEAGADAGVGA